MLNLKILFLIKEDIFILQISGSQDIGNQKMGKKIAELQDIWHLKLCLNKIMVLQLTFLLLESLHTNVCWDIGLTLVDPEKKFEMQF
jgi:hypothetical protein